MIILNYAWAGRGGNYFFVEFVFLPNKLDIFLCVCFYLGSTDIFSLHLTEGFFEEDPCSENGQ